MYVSTHLPPQLLAVTPAGSQASDAWDCLLVQVRPFKGINDAQQPISATMYTATMPLSKQVEAFEEAMSKDPSTWWSGDADLLAAAPAPAPLPLPPGPPTERASGFGLDSVRKGTDGIKYRVVAGGGRVVGGKVLGAVQNVWQRCRAAAATDQRKETGAAQGTRQPPSAAAPPTASSAAASTAAEW